MVWFCANTGSDIYVSGSGGSKGGARGGSPPPPETQKKKKMGQKEKKKKRKKKRKKKEKEEKKPNELIPIGNYPVKQWRLPPESMKQDFTQPITLFIAVSQSYLVISLKVTCA
jgi:hypothetical protein